MNLEKESHITAQDFLSYINQSIKIIFEPSVTLDAKIIEVEEKVQNLSDFRIPFSVVFRTSQKDEYYSQGTYVILHPTKGELHVFLVPIGPDDRGMRYEAVYS